MQDLGFDACDRNAAGALAVQLSGGFRDLVIWFRPEQIEEIRWGGDPDDKVLAQGESLPLLCPRQSFAEWKQLVSGCSRQWTKADEACAGYFLSGHVQEIMARVQVLATSYRDLERQDRAKDEFICLVSHELRTPLGIIISWVNIMKQDPNLSTESTRALEIIEKSASSQTVIVEDLLDIFRIKSGKMCIEVQNNVDVTSIISKVIESMRPGMATRGIKLFWDKAERVSMSVDPDRLCQILWNLLSNAEKFTAPGGEVHVQLTQNSFTTVIEVEDNGAGINSNSLESIFGSFVQDNSAALKLGGLGIGLAMVRGLAEMHGGTVRALSDGPGKGSRFIVELPNKNLTIAPDEQAKESKSSAHLLQDLRVLIAEDQPDILLALSVLCERAGGKVIGVKDGFEALDRLRSQSFDLILSDLSMPGLDGYGALKLWRTEEVLRNRQRVPAIAVSAYTSPKDWAKSLDAGFNAHIGKPVFLDELYAVIHSLGLKFNSGSEVC